VAQVECVTVTPYRPSVGIDFLKVVMFETRIHSGISRRPGRIILRVVEGPDRGKQVKIDLADRGTASGGRSDVNSLVLNDEHVSSTHFELVLTSRGVLLRDLNSRNGVHVQGVWIREGFITPDTCFRVGESVIQLVAADEVEVDLAPANRFEDIFGQSATMRELFATLERFASKGDRLRVMIGGETGTGKELVARALHQRSARRGKPFLIRDCATIPRELAESVLFGHRKGSFTGAVDNHAGCFEEAHGGTLFLDEIGELPLEIQAKLLRVVQEGTLTRVGENVARPVDVRVICATHRDLRTMVAEERFRKDLYFRLAEFKVEMPSLRERGDDVLLLADLFLRKSASAGGEERRFGADACGAMRTYSWPGNVRELKSVVERAYIMADGPVISATDLALDREDSDERRLAVSSELYMMTHEAALQAFERTYFEEILAHHPTRVKGARAAGMTTEGLRKALQRLKLDANTRR